MFLCFQFATDLGSGGESVKKIETKTFVGSAALNTAKTELTTVRLLLDEICHYFFSLLYKEFGPLISYFGFGLATFCKTENLKRLAL